MTLKLYSQEDVSFMNEAISQARLAESLGEVPIGAVIVSNGEIIAKACNMTITNNDPTAHAEILAIQHASKQLNNHRLVDTKLYVTLEPCIMCVGALIQARVSEVFFSSSDTRIGAISIEKIHSNRCLNHNFSAFSGLLSAETSTLLKEFFKKKR